MNRKSPLGEVLGLGSAKEGSGHWWNQRISAVALLPLGLWLMLSLINLSHQQKLGYEALVHWVRTPINAMLLSAAVTVMLYHSHLGIQVILEDYVKPGWSRVTAMILQKFLHIALAVAGVYSILMIAFGT